MTSRPSITPWLQPFEMLLIDGTFGPDEQTLARDALAYAKSLVGNPVRTDYEMGGVNATIEDPASNGTIKTGVTANHKHFMHRELTILMTDFSVVTFQWLAELKTPVLAIDPDPEDEAVSALAISNMIAVADHHTALLAVATSDAQAIARTDELMHRAWAIGAAVIVDAQQQGRANPHALITDLATPWSPLRCYLPGSADSEPSSILTPGEQMAWNLPPVVKAVVDTDPKSPFKATGRRLVIQFASILQRTESDDLGNDITLLRALASLPKVR